jgi:hypothetical protein
MSTDKKERVMTAKSFLHKATTKAAASADAFIKAHRAWLETGELAEMTSPILAKIDSKELMPTPALEVLKAVVLGHHMAVQTRKSEEAIAKAQAEPAKVKPWVSTIYNKDGQIVFKKDANGKEKDLTQSFELPQDADRWTDLRLFQAEPGCYGVIHSTTMTREDGDPISTVVMQGDATARILKQPTGPVVKGQAKSSGKLSFGVKSKPSVSRFSHG